MKPFTSCKYFLIVLFLLAIRGASLPLEVKASLSVTSLKTEYHTNPLGIDNLSPRLSWVIRSEAANTLQEAWQVQVAASSQLLETGNYIWDTDKINSPESIHNPYGGPGLQSGQRYYWRVRVWDNHGNVSPWSEAAWWEMGLLDLGDWQAEWIEPLLDEDPDQSQPAPMLRAEFTSPAKRIISARAYVTSHGVYEMYINERRVGDILFTPGWTSYNKRLQYQTYDITQLLQTGDNAVGVYLGDGWFRGYIGWGDQRNYYGDKLALLAQIVITYDDGTREVFGTGGDWKSSTGPILRSDIYNGEYYDARLEKEGWTLPGYNDRGWQGVRIAGYGKEKLIAQYAPPVIKIQELKPVAMFTTPEGDRVIDMGQNMIGWMKLRVRGPAGSRVTLRHAEVLDADGNLYTENLRSADQTNTYILKGGGIEIWEPRFTFQGFRYVAIDGYPGELSTENITGVVIHSEMEPTGHFQSSNPMVNQLQHNIVWGQKGNFLEVPTDCPQRDERMGWTGDIQVFASTANINMNTAAFLTKWLGDLEADQNDAGSVPHVVPNVLGDGAYGSAGWGDASLIVPWSLYKYFGDKRILEKQYESMKRWVNFIKSRAATNDKIYLWNVDHSFGDWLSYSTYSNARYPGAYTDFHMIGTMYFAHSADLLRRSAAILGKVDDVIEYTTLFENIKSAFRDEYLTPGGRVMSDTQTSYILSLAYDLLPYDLEEVAVNRLVTDIRTRGHLTTGFLGTPHLNPILSKYGHHETAYNLLLRESYPSWLYPVTMGATTIWERWDGIRPDGNFQSAGMNSFNHYAYGAIGEWLYETVAGIQPSSPGYRDIIVSPVPGGGFTHARAIIHSMYGRIESSWEIEGDRFSLFVEIPVNTEATIVLPRASLDTVEDILIKTGTGSGIKSMEQSGDNVLVKAGSGNYSFAYRSEELAAGEDGGEDMIPALSIDNKIGELIAVGQSREILYRLMPGLINSPWLSQVMGFTLRQAMQTLPDRYKVSGSVLEKIDSELKNVR